MAEPAIEDIYTNVGIRGKPIGNASHDQNTVQVDDRFLDRYNVGAEQVAKDDHTQCQNDHDDRCQG